MKEQVNTIGETTLEGIPWFNIRYEIRLKGESCADYETNRIPSGEIIPHPVGMSMTIEQFSEAQRRLGKSEGFLEVECEKLESPQNNPTSVKLINSFRAVYGGPLTRAIPDAIIDAGFGEMYHRTYVCRDKSGVVTLRTSTGNKYANEIGLYCFSKAGFREVVRELGLPIREDLTT